MPRNHVGRKVDDVPGSTGAARPHPESLTEKAASIFTALKQLERDSFFVMAGLVPRLSGTACACHAAFSVAAPARIWLRRCAARVACGPKSNLDCCGAGGGVAWRSSAITRRCIRFVRRSLAKASGLVTILLAS